MNKKTKIILFREQNFALLAFYFQNFMKGINLHQKSKKIEILVTKGWNRCFWVKNMEWQVFAKIFHCAPSLHTHDSLNFCGVPLPKRRPI